VLSHPYSAVHNLENISDPTPGVTNQVDDYSHIIWLGFPSLGPATVIKFY
jgi:hypothetical protein